MFRLVASEAFLRQARKFLKRHPDLRPRLGELLDELQKDPFQPHLGLHPLGGRLAGCHAVRLTYGYRVTLTLLVSEKEITLLDIGSHDQVYR
ncbi:MAG: plasmid stabilization protein [Deltaproteobacteria bacterium]|nr:plasmid stabilization protein [Deltaproteobacteria bacterium]